MSGVGCGQYRQVSSSTGSSPEQFADAVALKYERCVVSPRSVVVAGCDMDKLVQERRGPLVR